MGTYGPWYGRGGESYLYHAEWGHSPQKTPKILRFRADTVGILAICGETGSEMRKVKQTCSTRVFGLQYAFYGMSVAGGVSEIRLPVFATFFHKRCV